MISLRFAMKNTLKRSVMISKPNPKNRRVLNGKKTLTGIRRKTVQKNQVPRDSIIRPILERPLPALRSQIHPKSPEVPRRIIKPVKEIQNKGILSSSKFKTAYKSEKKTNDHNILKNRIQKSIFRPKHTLVSHGRVYNVCKTCPSYLRKRLKVLK